MRMESIDDLKKLLSKIGYSPKAVSEILKWYRDNTTDRRA